MRRADKILQELYPELSRNKIQALIKRKKIFYKSKEQWQTLAKPSQSFSLEDPLQWKIEEDEIQRFVSRAGLKLDGALEHFKLDVSGLLCLDVGLSTGGFSDCLLQRGAKKILGIDVGHSQLHVSLQKKDNLISLDGINARNPLPIGLLKEQFGREKEIFELIVIDVSFISLDKILVNLLAYLSQQGSLVALVKPQFEVGKGNLNKKGVVKNQTMVVEVVEKSIELFRDNGLKILGQMVSPLEGENGNKEVFLWAEKA